MGKGANPYKVANLRSFRGPSVLEQIAKKTVAKSLKPPPSQHNSEETALEDDPDRASTGELNARPDRPDDDDDDAQDETPLILRRRGSQPTSAATLAADRRIHRRDISPKSIRKPVTRAATKKKKGGETTAAVPINVAVPPTATVSEDKGQNDQVPGLEQRMLQRFDEIAALLRQIGDRQLEIVAAVRNLCQAANVDQPAGSAIPSSSAIPPTAGPSVPMSQPSHGGEQLTAEMPPLRPCTQDGTALQVPAADGLNFNENVLPEAVAKLTEETGDLAETSAQFQQLTKDLEELFGPEDELADYEVDKQAVDQMSQELLSVSQGTTEIFIDKTATKIQGLGVKEPRQLVQQVVEEARMAGELTDIAKPSTPAVAISPSVEVQEDARNPWMDAIFINSDDEEQELPPDIRINLREVKTEPAETAILDKGKGKAAAQPRKKKKAELAAEAANRQAKAFKIHDGQAELPSQHPAASTTPSTATSKLPSCIPQQSAVEKLQAQLTLHASIMNVYNLHSRNLLAQGLPTVDYDAFCAQFYPGTEPLNLSLAPVLQGHSGSTTLPLSSPLMPPPKDVPTSPLPVVKKAKASKTTKPPAAKSRLPSVFGKTSRHKRKAPELASQKQKKKKVESSSTSSTAESDTDSNDEDYVAEKDVSETEFSDDPDIPQQK